MLIFITGGSASGKSEYAGKLAEKLADGSAIRYIATMPEQGSESRDKIRRHEILRRNGNYEVSLCLSLEELEETTGNRFSVVLLDSLDGFLADVMFGTEGEQKTVPANRFMAVLEQWQSCMEHVIVVSDDVYRDGVTYDRLTEQYIEVLASLSRRIGSKADVLIEVVFGIPVLIKPDGAPDRSGDIHSAAYETDPGRSKGELYALLEIPYHDDVYLHQGTHAEGGVE